jgi:hypothetical protein
VCGCVRVCVCVCVCVCDCDCECECECANEGGFERVSVCLCVCARHEQCAHNLNSAASDQAAHVFTVITGQQDAGKQTNKVNGTDAIAARQEAGTHNATIHADAAIVAARDHNDTASGGEGSTQPDD